MKKNEKSRMWPKSTSSDSESRKDSEYANITDMQVSRHYLLKNREIAKMNHLSANQMKTAQPLSLQQRKPLNQSLYLISTETNLGLTKCYL
jgi:hypothetical protein